MARPYAVIGFTLFFVMGLFFEFEIGVTVTALAVFAAALVVCLVVKSVRRNRTLPVIFVSAVVACSLLICENAFVYNPAMQYDGKTGCTIKAEITDMPEIKYGNYYYAANAFEIGGKSTDVDIRLVFSTPPEIEPYDVIEGNFNIFALGASDESFAETYKARGVFLGAYPANDDYFVYNISDSEKPFMKNIIDFREGIKAAVYRIMPDECGALALALLIGDKAALPDRIYSDFNTLGISHIICVSGFHLSLWAMLILKILKKTRLNFRVCNIIAACGVVLFMLVAGMTYSVIRSGIMMLVFLVGNVFLRQRDSLNSLGFAIAVLAVFKPFSMGSESLQLSVLATAGILLYSLYIEPDVVRLIDKIKNKFVSGMLRKAVFPFMVTFSATAFTLPVSLGINNSFNFLSFAANLIAVPLAGLTMVSSAFGAFAGLFIPLEYNLPAFVSKIFCKCMIALSSYLAEFDLFVFGVSSDKIAIILGGIFLFCIVVVFTSVLRKNIYTVAAAVCAVMFSLCWVTLSLSESKETRITVADCGNGTTVLVSTDGENVLIGAGGSDFLGESTVKDLISEAGGELDAVFVPRDEEASSAYLRGVLNTSVPDSLYFDELPFGLDLMVTKSEKHGFTDTYITENIFVKSYNIRNNYCTYIKTGDISAVVCFDPSFDYSLLPQALKNADVIISRSNFPFGTFEFGNSFYVLSAEKKRAENFEKYSAFPEKSFASTGGNGNVMLRALDGNLKAEKD